MSAVDQTYKVGTVIGPGSVSACRSLALYQLSAAVERARLTQCLDV